MKHPTMLVILDGFGYSPEKKYNAIARAHTPNFSYWFSHYPHALLAASGTAVGLLAPTIGNSECGHQTIGAGRKVMQPITILDKKIESDQLSQDTQLKKYFNLLKQNNGRLHLMGLLSDGGIHSHEKHAHALLKLAAENGITTIYIHPFLDGRDSSPKSAITYLDRLDKVRKKIGAGTVSSIHGRFYAMDRNHNWDRTQKSYDVLTSSKTSHFSTAQEAVDNFYNQGIYDEFIPPTPLATHSPIENNDGVIFFNIRPERAVQLTDAFCDPAFDHFRVKKLNLSFFITGVEDAVLKSDYGLVQPLQVKNTFFDVLSQHHLSIFTIAESEKYAHVTYFFSSRHVSRKNETRIKIPSLIRETYKDVPEMEAGKITKTVLTSLKKDPYDFYLINYANADMVGHSGDLPATIKAIEFLDKQLAELKEEVVDKQNGTLYITADHGNAECMWDSLAQQQNTRHTSNPVPFIMIKKGLGPEKLSTQTLGDIAPFILKNMGFSNPEEMAT